MVSQPKAEIRVNARVPVSLMPMYEALLQNGYTPSEIAREGIRTAYRKMNTQPKEATA